MSAVTVRGGHHVQLEPIRRGDNLIPAQPFAPSSLLPPPPVTLESASVGQFGDLTDLLFKSSGSSQHPGVPNTQV
jgi:hypothetical protein